MVGRPCTASGPALFLTLLLKHIVWGCARGWKVTQPGWWLMNHRDIPCHITSCSAIKTEGTVFRSIRHLLFGNWLGISLPMRDDDLLAFHHFFGLVSFSFLSLFLQLWNIFYFNPQLFLLFLFPLRTEAGRKWASICVLAPYQGSTTTPSKRKKKQLCNRKDINIYMQ